MSVGNELRTLFCFMLSVALLASVLIFPLPFNDVSYIEDPSLHLGIRQAIYWGSGIAAFFFITNKLDKVDLASFIVILFGPLAFMFISVYWLTLKIVPRKPLQTGDRGIGEEG